MLTPKQYFESHGISIKEVSQVIGRTERTTKRKLDELSTWKGAEMTAICDRYEDFNPNYFFYSLRLKQRDAVYKQINALLDTLAA